MAVLLPILCYVATMGILHLFLDCTMANWVVPTFLPSSPTIANSSEINYSGNLVAILLPVLWYVTIIGIVHMWLECTIGPARLPTLLLSSPTISETDDFGNQEALSLVSRLAKCSIHYLNDWGGYI